MKRAGKRSLIEESIVLKEFALDNLDTLLFWLQKEDDGDMRRQLLRPFEEEELCIETIRKLYASLNLKAEDQDLSALSILVQTHYGQQVPIGLAFFIRKDQSLLSMEKFYISKIYRRSGYEERSLIEVLHQIFWKMSASSVVTQIFERNYAYARLLRGVGFMQYQKVTKNNTFTPEKVENLRLSVDQQDKILFTKVEQFVTFHLERRDFIHKMDIHKSATDLAPQFSLAPLDHIANLNFQTPRASLESLQTHRRQPRANNMLLNSFEKPRDSSLLDAQPISVLQRYERALLHNHISSLNQNRDTSSPYLRIRHRRNADELQNKATSNSPPPFGNGPLSIQLDPSSTPDSTTNLRRQHVLGEVLTPLSLGSNQHLSRRTPPKPILLNHHSSVQPRQGNGHHSASPLSSLAFLKRPKKKRVQFVEKGSVDELPESKRELDAPLLVGVLGRKGSHEREGVGRYGKVELRHWPTDL